MSYRKAVRTLQEFEGIVEQASEEELADASARADRTGMFNCPHTGVALAVLVKLRERGVIGPRERVVVVSTAHGLKFADQKAAYHQKKLAGIASRFANQPIELPNDLGRVRDAMLSAIDAVAAANAADEAGRLGSGAAS